MTLRRSLRDGTGELHSRLDRLVERNGHFDSLEGYSRWLIAMHAFYGETALALSNLEADDIVDQQAWTARLCRLSADLTDLSATIPPPPAETDLEIHDEVDALGLLYVTEGASLGARLLVRRVRALGCSENYGARHLSAEARGNAAWQRISAIFEARELDSEASARLVSMSRRVFSLAAASLGDRHDDP